MSSEITRTVHKNVLSVTFIFFKISFLCRAARNGLEVTLMERILKHSSVDVVRMLTTQYRMNRAIMQWSSDQLYDGKLVAHESVRDHLLK